MTAVCSVVNFGVRAESLNRWPDGPGKEFL